MNTYAEAKALFERDYIRKLLKETNGNVVKAARIAGRNRCKIYELFNRHGIKPKEYRAKEAA